MEKLGIRDPRLNWYHEIVNLAPPKARIGSWTLADNTAIYSVRLQNGIGVVAEIRVRDDKAFLHSLVLALWHEVKPDGVDILLLAPGSADTNASISQGTSRILLRGYTIACLLLSCDAYPKHGPSKWRVTV